MIIIGYYGRWISELMILPIVGGVAGCGIFLIIISLIGLVGAAKHHQVILFFVSFSLNKRKTNKNKCKILIDLQKFSLTKYVYFA